MSAADLFPGAGQSPGVECWRIEAMRPVKLPSNFSGKFHAGDSYIVLHTWEHKGILLLNVHFWIGTESTRDEAGAAALFTVELDQLLGDLPTQFRETQGHESDEFLQIFPNGVHYLEGGVESGFKTVDRDAYTTRLLHVKGKRNVRVMQVTVCVESLNSGDVFLLDTGKTITQWNGSTASRAEKAKALDVALSVKSEEHGGKSSFHAIDQTGCDFTDDTVKAFFAVLNESSEGNEKEDAAVSATRIKSANEGGDDDEMSKSTSGAGAVRLYHVCDDDTTGTLTMTELCDRPLGKESLKTEDVFVLCAGGVVYVWVGKKTSAAERDGANEFLQGGERAVKFLDLNRLPRESSVKIVKEGTETALFKQAFHRWGVVAVPKPASGFSKKEEKEKQQVDVSALIAGSESNTVTNAFDDGVAGVLAVWRVEDFKLVGVKEAFHGQFFCGDSYVLHYAYDEGKRHVVYFWQGRESSTDEKAASGLLAREVSDTRAGGVATQVRVVQGKEPEHFCSLFRGRMVVRSGGKASGFRNVDAADTYDEDGVCLYHVRGRDGTNVRAVQVADDAACLNSGDCFILTLEARGETCAEDDVGVVTKQPPSDPRVLVWIGAGSSEAEKACANMVATLLAPGVGVGSSRVELVEEGKEPDIFWERIGGKKSYAKFSRDDATGSDPRLFQLCDAKSGGVGITAEEVFHFTQDDLDDDDVMLLDVATEIFLWIGKRANENERNESLKLAEQFVAVAAATDGRDTETPITSIPSGSEPNLFTRHFTGWDITKASRTFVDPYEMKLKQLIAANPAVLEVHSLRKTPAKKETEKDDSFALPALRDALSPLKTMSPLTDSTSSPTKDDQPASPKAATPHATPGAPSPAAGVREVTTPSGSRVIALDELLVMDGGSGLDLSKKESYLSYEQFEEVFGMTRGKFDALAEWKRKDAKKKVGLF